MEAFLAVCLFKKQKWQSVHLYILNLDILPQDWGNPGSDLQSALNLTG